MALAPGISHFTVSGSVVTLCLSRNTTKSMFLCSTSWSWNYLASIIKLTPVVYARPHLPWWCHNRLLYLAAPAMSMPKPAMGLIR